MLSIKKSLILAIGVCCFISPGISRAESSDIIPSEKTAQYATTTGWKEVDGKWYYYKDGVMQTGWQSLQGAWYYFNASGAMQTGWQQINETWYYFHSSGTMQTGWQQIEGNWYYLNPISDGSLGAMRTGWQSIEGAWYYFNSSGAMHKGWLTLNGQTYYLDYDGTMVKGWKYVDKKRKWYEFNTSGQQVKKYGWQVLNNKHVFYDFGDAGLYTNKWYFIDNKTYEFDVNGYWVENSFDNTTLGELEQALLKYFKENGITYKVGTQEYEMYLIDQLLEHKDEKLARHPKYTKILTYAAEYLHERNKGQSLPKSPSVAKSTEGNENAIFSMGHVANKTIKDIKEETDKEDSVDIVEEKMIQKSPETKESPTVQRAYYYYNPNAAVNYALKWAISRNGAYDDRSGSGGDCTNFVSQALYAGGMMMNLPGEISTSSRYVTDGGWFSRRFESSVPTYRVSSSWINVEMFYSYWAPRSTMVTKTWSPMQVYYGSSPGDVIQYQYAGGGRKWHSLMVTGKNTSKRTIYISQHSGDRKNEDYGNIDKDYNGDSQWIILKLTN